MIFQRLARAILALLLATTFVAGCADDDDLPGDRLNRTTRDQNFPKSPAPAPVPKPVESPEPMPTPDQLSTPTPTPTPKPGQEPKPAPTPGQGGTPSPQPTPDQAKKGWKKIQYRESSDLLGPAMCDQPYKLTVYANGQYEAEKCIWRDADNVDMGQKYQGQLTPVELQAINREVAELTREISTYQRNCDSAANIVTKEEIDLWSGSDQSYRIWQTTEEEGLCVLGPLPRVSQLHLQIREVRDAYFPPPTMSSASVR